MSLWTSLARFSSAITHGLTGNGIDHCAVRAHEFRAGCSDTGREGQESEQGADSVGHENFLLSDPGTVAKDRNQRNSGETARAHACTVRPNRVPGKRADCCV